MWTYLELGPSWGMGPDGWPYKETEIQKQTQKRARDNEVLDSEWWEPTATTKSQQSGTEDLYSAALGGATSYGTFFTPYWASQLWGLRSSYVRATPSVGVAMAPFWNEYNL